MSDHSSHFEATGGGLVLTNAILLYQAGTSRTPTAYGAPRNDVAAFASMHAVELDGGACRDCGGQFGGGGLERKLAEAAEGEAAELAIGAEE